GKSSAALAKAFGKSGRAKKTRSAAMIAAVVKKFLTKSPKKIERKRTRGQVRVSYSISPQPLLCANYAFAV
ncbi:hypothetical protein IL306_008517, partial [Fusarium sp. DS 682]